MQNKTINPLKDANLIKLVQSGDKSTFELFFDEISSDLKSYLDKITGNSDIARDIFQDTFIRANNWVLEKKYKVGNFKAWVFSIAHNLWIDHIRTIKVRKIISIDDLPYELEDEDKMKYEEKNYDWNKILSELSSKIRETFVLRYIRGFKFEEMSEMLNTNINTLKARAWKGKIDLRKILSKI